MIQLWWYFDIEKLTLINRHSSRISEQVAYRKAAINVANAHNIVMFKLESDVNDYVKAKLSALGLKKLIDFNEESGMSDYMKDALKGSAKTKDKTSFGKPDFHIE